jgi:hypothetical protein
VPCLSIFGKDQKGRNVGVSSSVLKMHASETREGDTRGHGRRDTKGH